MSAFTDCALAFRFKTIDHLPEPPSPWTTRGTLVHSTLEQLFCLPPAERTLDAALTCLAGAVDAIHSHPDFTGLGLDDEAEQGFVDEAEVLVRRYFQLEDPTRVHAIGLELYLEAEVDGIILRGIIDRLDWVDGELVVTDYKTGRAPAMQHERHRLAGVHFYALLCEEVFGKRPVRVQLLHLAEPVALLVEPSERSTRGVRRTAAAVWKAVERACERDDFRPNPSRLCDYCAFKSYCPAFGGDPALAATATVEATAEPVPATL